MSSRAPVMVRWLLTFLIAHISPEDSCLAEMTHPYAP